MPPWTAGAQSASCAPACCAPSGSDRPDPSCWTCPDKSIPYPPAEIRRPCSASKKFLKISFKVARAGGLTCWTEAAKGGNRIETSTCGRTAPKTTDCCWCGLKSVSCKARKVVVSFKFSIRRSRKTYSHRSSCTLIKLLTCNNPHKRSANIEKKAADQSASVGTRIVASLQSFQTRWRAIQAPQVNNFKKSAEPEESPLSG